MPASNFARSSLVSITQLLQQRRRDQKTQQFKERMHQRSAIEGTISELARAHGSRRSRYRGFAKVELQNLFIFTACNVKRWLQVPLEAKTPSNTQPLPFSDLLYNPVPVFEIVQSDLNPFSFFAQQAVLFIYFCGVRADGVARPLANDADHQPSSTVDYTQVEHRALA